MKWIVHFVDGMGQGSMEFENAKSAYGFAEKIEQDVENVCWNVWVEDPIIEE